MNIKPKRKDIAILYRNLLHRSPTNKEVINHLSSQKSLYEIQLSLWKSAEYTHNIFDKINPVDIEPLSEHLPIYVINLKKRTDRKQQIEKQLHNLGITNFNIVEAIDGTTNKNIEKIRKSYDSDRAKLTHREMANGEIATSLSHVKVCQMIVAKKMSYALILEDDALLTLNFKDLIKNFDVKQDYIFDVLMLGSVSNNHLDNNKVKIHDCFTTLVEQNSVIYLQQPEYKIGALNICSPAYPSWDLNPILTTHAYIVSYQGAQKIIDFNKKIFVPIDLTWNISRNIILKLTHKITVFQTPVDQDSDVYVSRNSLVRNTIWPNIENPDWGT